MQPCLNPNCKSHGKPHPNCMCHVSMAEGGSIQSVCELGQPHSEDCQYFSDGGIAFTPDPAPSAPGAQSEAPIDFQLDDQSSANEAKYGTPGQQAITAAEGLGKGLAGPLATLAETKLGVKAEDIKGRAAANPITHGVSEAAGFIAPALTGAGEFTQAGALGELGKAAAEGLGLQGAKATAVKLGAENALYALGDEVSKAIVNSPDSVQTAALHVGLSGLLGAGVGLPLGAVSELWASKVGPKAEAFVKDFTDTLKANASDTVEPLAEESGNFVPTPDEPIKNLPRPGSPLKKATVETPAPEEAAPGPGSRDAKKFIDHISNLATEAVADGIGGSVGHIAGRLTGIPGLGLLGGYIGHNSIAPMLRTLFPTVIKPLLESESSAMGLKAAFDTVSAVAKGETLLNNATKQLFETGSNQALQGLTPDHDKLDALDEKVSQLGQNPQQLLQDGGSLGHYMPNHQTALSATNQNAINYLNSNRPQGSKPGVLNAVVEPTPLQHQGYQNTLTIAEQPLVVLDKLIRGTLSPKDVQDLSVLYPALKNNIIQKINNQMIDHLSKGKSVPFKMRRGLSMLMGQPMDAAFTAPAILAAQATYMPQQSPQMAQGGAPTKKSTSKLGKTVELAQTPAEARIKALQKA